MKKIILFFAVVLLLCTTAYASGNDEQMKGVWVSTIYNLDFPSSPTVNSQVLKAEIDEIIKNCSDMGFNAVFLQVRPSSDAIYPSKIYPWSKYISGNQETCPDNGFDPLEYWVKKCHENSIKIHAWINPYRITKGGDNEYAQLSPHNPAVIHPEWTVKYSDGNYYYNPAIPEVRQLVIDGVKEIVTNYDVDGIHMDDYFYPGQNFNDNDSYETYNNEEFSNIADWRRNNVNILIKSLYETVKLLKEDVAFGISPAGIWDNKSSNPLGSDTNGKSSYSSLYADSRKWVKEGWVDYLAPQLYWEFGYGIADYEILSKWWSDVFEGSDVKLYIGLGDYRCVDASVSSPWYNGAEIQRQMDYNKITNTIDGEIHFRYKMINNNSNLKQLISKNYEPAIKVLLEGQELVFDQPPVLKNDRTLVPMRAVFEAFGFDVNWNGSTNTVDAKNGIDNIIMKIGDNDFTVNEKKFSLDVPACIINNRTLVPIRAISESLNCSVNWIADTKTVEILK